MKHGALGLILLLALTAAAPLAAVRIQLDPPGERAFILDRAGMLDAADASSIRVLCDKLLSEKATPIVVVTIESMARYGGEDLRIETFATLLFNQWAIGQEKVRNEYWNTGIMLLISRDDRAARIELGAGWGREQDALAQRIMDERIIPEFKQGRFSAGILAGVESLDRMARRLELPGQPGAPVSGTTTSGGGFLAGLAGLALCPLIVVIAIIGTVLRFIRGATGFGGWGGRRYGGWGGRFRSGGGFSSGGGFRSFGGGFSRGGGASGRW